MDRHDLTEQLHFLIKCLEAEMPEYAGYAMPEDPKQAFNLYRALCNIRMPSGDTGHTLPDDFYTVQSEVLQNITEEKGITEAAALSPARLDQRLFLWQGDITTLQVDAIVNAANVGSAKLIPLRTFATFKKSLNYGTLSRFRTLELAA